MPATTTDTDIERIFATDPLQLSDLDIAAAVGYFRSNRQRYLQGNKKAGKPPSRKSAAQKKAEAAAAIVGDIDLDDL